MQEVVVLVFILYYLLVIWLWLGWRRAGRSRRPLAGSQPFVTIVVPVRNEANIITALMADLCAQKYAHYEVLLVDDHSADSTREAIEKHIIYTPDTKVVLLHNQGVGKKAAIETAVKAARGEWIIQTDADCRVTPDWIDRMVLGFSDTSNMVLGGVRICATDFFGEMQRMEFASLIGSGAATLGWNLPTMANGANLAYRKKAFEAVDGYSGNEHLASGDDEFLLHKVNRAFPGTVTFNNDSGSVIETRQQPTVASFIHQRVRWAAKWKSRRDVATQLTALLVLLCQIVFLATPWLILSGVVAPSHALLLLTAKALVEYWFFRPVLHFLSIRFSVLAFSVLQLLYPYYVVGIAVLTLTTKSSWKDRES